MMTAPIRLSAAAGGKGGSWYALLEGLAELVHRVHPSIEIEVVEGGGISNHAQVGSGELDMAILNPPMTAAALAGESPFETQWPELRVGVANLTANYLHFVVAGEVPLISLEEWFQRKHPLRLPVDRSTTVDRLVFQIMLDHYGVSLADLEAWGGGAIPADNYYEQLDLYQRGKVDALWQFMGIPSPSIQEANANRPIRVLPTGAGLIEDLVQRGWIAAEIPTGAYGVVNSPIPTVSMGTSLGFHSAVPDQVVLDITTTICEHAAEVRAIHPAASDFDPGKACDDPGGPLHPGAEGYFKFKGFMV
jgi:TRAP transporter TAXI family solute receptor